MRNALIGAAVVVALALAVAAAVIGTGVYNVAADEKHSALVHWLLETARERSITARANQLAAPPLEDQQRIRRGAGNYDAMCAGCHLSPHAEPTEIHKGLYPRPPDLTKVVQSDAARAFWIIKHGLKATGMPAWGKSMEDEYIWDMVAFLRKLPVLTAQQYAEEVRASGGHSHGGNESTESDAGSEPHEKSGSDHSHEESGGDHSHEHEAGESHPQAR
jgi:mono/diheme cytochrome c family protein